MVKPSDDLEWSESVLASLVAARGLDEAMEKVLAAASTLVEAKQVFAFIERQGHVDEPISIYRSHPTVSDAEVQRIASQSSYSSCQPGFLDDHGYRFPLRSRGRTLGAILLRGAEIGVGEERALRMLATRAAIVLDNLVLCRNEWTRLPNLSAIKPALAQMLNDARAPVALFFIDIDNFKSVNSKVGYFGGGEFLTQFASRLTECAALKAGWFGHISGDEFVYVLPLASGGGDAGAMAAAAAIRQALEYSFFVDGQQLNVTVSIGISLYPRDAMTMEDLLQQADRAALDAKRAGKDTCRIYRTSASR